MPNAIVTANAAWHLAASRNQFKYWQCFRKKAYLSETPRNGVQPTSGHPSNSLIVGVVDTGGWTRGHHGGIKWKTERRGNQWECTYASQHVHVIKVAFSGTYCHCHPAQPSQGSGLHYLISNHYHVIIMLILRNLLCNTVTL